MLPTWSEPSGMGSGRRGAGRLVLVLAVLVTLVLPLALRSPDGASAQSGRSVEWARFDVALDLLEDGTYHVTERQVIDFSGGPFRGGFRDIPLARIEEIRNVQVYEETADELVPYRYVPPEAFADEPGTYTLRTSPTQLTIDWGFAPATDERRTFVLEYDAAGALRSYEDPPNQQIWWTAVGEELTRTAPVREATLTVRLPEPVDLAEVLVGGDAEGEPADYTDDGQVFAFAESDLSGGESFEVRLQFPPLVAAAPPSWQQLDDERRRREEEVAERGAVLNVVFLGAGLLLAVGGGLGLYGLWYTRGRDPHTGLVADFLPQPPDDLPPGAAGTLLDERADEQDVVATLLDLAHRGVVTIEEMQNPGFLGFGGSRDFALTLVKEDLTAKPIERDLLRSLFGRDLQAGKTARLSEVKSRFVQAQPALKEDLYAELVSRGYFPRSPEATRGRWRTGAIVALIAVLVGGCLTTGLFAAVAAFVWFPVIVAAGLALSLMALSGVMPRKTAAGAEAAARWRAFRRYLESIEKYERLDEAKEIFDRYLPYAVAFGLERSWVRKFASVDTPTPAWYGGGGFGGEIFDLGPSPRYPHRRRSFGGGTVIIPGGGSFGGGWGDSRGGGGGRDFDVDLPDLQGTSDRAGRTLQGSSDSLFDMLNTAARVFGGFSGGGRGGGWGGGGGFGGGGGSSGGGGGGFR